MQQQEMAACRLLCALLARGKAGRTVPQCLADAVLQGSDAPSGGTHTQPARWPQGTAGTAGKARRPLAHIRMMSSRMACIAWKRT